MNRLEFKKVIEVTGINNIIPTTKGTYDYEKQLYSWNNINIQFSGNTAIITGKIPLEFAKIIYSKYDSNNYLIRINGKFSNLNPEEHYYIDNNHKYIEKYHIYTKEGLTIFLIEFEKYMSKKKNVKNSKNKEIAPLIAQINCKVLKKMNLSITNNEWIKNIKADSKIFFDTIRKSQTSEFDKKFRILIEEFDKVVNPYMYRKEYLECMDRYIEKVNINTDIKLSEETEKIESCRIDIEDKTTKNKVTYFRNAYGFSYQLRYQMNNGEYLFVKHQYHGTSKIIEGETINISYFKNEYTPTIDMKYNLTDGSFGTTYEKTGLITKEQKVQMYNELLKALNLAKEITINNMKEKPKVKKLA